MLKLAIASACLSLVAIAASVTTMLLVARMLESHRKLARTISCLWEYVKAGENGPC